MSSTVTTALGSLPSVTDPSEPPTTAKNTLDKNSFIRLLTTQLQKQDPLNPMDSTAFVAQLAQFSSLEAQENMSTKLDTLALGQANANQLAVPQMIGKQVLFKASQLALTKGQTSGFSVSLGDAADQVVATLTDASGRTVRTLTLGARGAGASAVTWDGLDDSGNQLPSGRYSLTVVASKLDGTLVKTATSVRGIVTGVSFEGSVPQLIVAGTTVKLSDVSEIASPPPGV
jgi:flagellar basal-body rod modification protein FlgD